MVTYNAALYKSSSLVAPEEVMEYFDTIQLRWRDEAHSQNLEVPFNVEDIVRAIWTMPTCKAPRLDGLTTRFIKNTPNPPNPHLKAMFEEARDIGVLPLSVW
ncbi:hypothetical protein NDU88_007950 [Pleurodeles waltl]|uniref:Uncharacterized protein n=1 Tax=Pleurodeles waltl TaxID=8319 RepID=A0AAV7P3L8_PLEWA|nr:hypothetical protein NDU88_007950 [Pleurodeles waltl]